MESSCQVLGRRRSRGAVSPGKAERRTPIMLEGCLYDSKGGELPANQLYRLSILADASQSEKRATNNMRQNLRRIIKIKLLSQIEKAIDVGKSGVQVVVRNKTTAMIPSASWKAIIRRDGDQYDTKKMVTYHFNEDLASPYMMPLLKFWRAIFFQKLPFFHSKYHSIVGASLTIFE